jgi:hypothetical protein
MMKPPKPKDSRAWRDSYYHRLFGLKAAKEAEECTTFRTGAPGGPAAARSHEAIREWRKASAHWNERSPRLSLAAHAAARDARSDAAKFAAHAAGQAVGSWHAPAHALGAFGYAGRAFIAGRKKPS